MSIRHPVRAAGVQVGLVAVLVLSAFASASATSEGPKRDYIVTLDVADAVAPLNTAARRGRQRMRARTTSARDTSRRLERAHGFRVRHRYGAAVAGFSARLTSAQAARVRRDSSVASIRPARRYRVASQVEPAGMVRTRAIRDGGPHPDVDVDIAVVDTGIGPVGGGELNVQGGINCSDDTRGPDEWQDFFSSHHGTHVAGIAAARDNDVGSIGVAPGARLWSVRVFTAGGFGSEATIICGLDWIVATHSGTPPAGTQPIEVVNMSLQGPRLPVGPDACGVGTDPDAMHVAICSVHAAGITTVVAAGNNATNAVEVSPAAYDQVITVGAINDFDGEDGSKGEACQFWTSERDDRYAGYSNYGGRVDIVAPGTCVRSTQPSGDGTLTSLLTGTSMASPHVAGAVARFIADNPGTDPDQMRRIVRAAGRLDWSTGSDPTSRSVPLRLLDVRALTGSHDVKPWVKPKEARLGPGNKAKSFRVDIQRHGGYAGDVTIDIPGLPAGVTDGNYDPGRTISGLSQLGARMILRSASGGDDFKGMVDIRARGPGGSPSGTRELKLVNDRSGPKITGLGAKIRSGGRSLGSGRRASISLRWKAMDIVTSVKTNKLQRRRGGGQWKTIAKGARVRKGVSDIKPGQPVRFRVRATDKVGNISNRSITVRTAIRDSASAAISQASGAWNTQRNSKAIGGGVLRSAQPAATLTSTFDGTGIAVVAPTGPGRGRIRIRVDGGPWKTIKLADARTRHRRVVYSKSVPAGTHVIELKRAKGNPAIDALIILR